MDQNLDEKVSRHSSFAVVYERIDTDILDSPGFARVGTGVAD
jgi:hypothetical protein